MKSIESNSNIGAYLSSLIDRKYASRRKFYKAYLISTEAEATDDELQKMSNRFSQILKGIKAIQTYDLIPVSTLLDVSIESILTAGKTNKPSTSRVTNYSISFSDNESDWEKYINREDKLILNYDERGKNIIDYIFEAKNYRFLKYLINKQYINFIDNSEWYMGYSFGGSTTIKRRDPLKTDMLEFKLKSDDDLRQKVLSLAIENDDLALLVQYRARELPFMYHLNRLSHFQDIDYYNDKDNDYLTKISTSSDEVISFFAEEFSVQDQFGHNEVYLYPYIAEVVDIMIKNGHKKVNDILKIILNHNKQTFEELNKKILSAMAQHIDSLSSNPDYPIPEEIKSEYKKALLSDLHIDKSKHLVSFFYCHGRNNNPGIVTNIFNISHRSDKLSFNKLIEQINEYYDKIVGLKFSE